ncbi:hypothetical protein R5N98_03805 [Tenacibaculum maritimum]|uniref:hypothetical protein n=8 Tax=Tenacibaculum maritimum TaxID=107401 RepID=UPI0010A450ED|nr:hypothetical protein [Tenacibaculum maritimum]MCD9583742.1 hypothetical protein [Tenacibaculum maritimum]MCD9619470.1 hypothetical protein [Tenacibaculum maritimum]MCD9626188.1 hypothetical protein [Tenacibaculum maritimum]MCD9629180.1 hypothetical protein [Tenacibaculum maritimum]MCD9631599.1 hypothetical protein [Tenacibaculum maritimum]
MSFIIMQFSCKRKAQIVSGNKDLIDTKREEVVYSLDNFKDVEKKFNFFGESYSTNKKTTLMNDIFYTAAILPKEYYIKKYLEKKDSLSIYKEKLKNEEIIQFDFQSIDKKDLFLRDKKGVYEEYIKYFSFRIKNDFYAVTSERDTIKPVGVFFERTYKLTPFKRLLIYFKFPKEVNELKLVYHDKVFGNEFFKFKLEK